MGGPSITSNLEVRASVNDMKFTTAGDYMKDVEIGSVKQIVGMSRLVGHPSKEGHRKIADYVISKL